MEGILDINSRITSIPNVFLQSVHKQLRTKNKYLERMGTHNISI